MAYWLGRVTEEVEQLVGRTIDGRYRIEAQIGAGGMGVVYRARQLNVRRDVAIKVLHRERLGDEEAVAQFVEEATAVSQLRSPHSVTLIDVGELGEGDAFLVMELVEGRTLQQLLAERVPDADETADIVDAIAQALGEAHARGIVHRDIKPSNVMLARTPGHDAFVKVLDYGLAAPVGDRERIAGTPAYMAPEVIAEGRCTPASDVYALGVLLFELLTGEPPFSGAQDAILEAHLHTEPPLDEVELPKRVRKLIARCLAKHPGLRPADASAFRRELLRAFDRPQAPARLADAGDEHAPATGGETLTTMASLRGAPVERPSSRRRQVAGAGLALAVAAVVVVAMRGTGTEGQAPASVATASASVLSPASASVSAPPTDEAPAPPMGSASAASTSSGAPAASPVSPPTPRPTAPRPSVTKDDYDQRLDTILPPPAPTPAPSGFDDKLDAILD